MTSALSMSFDERFGTLKELMRAAALVALAGREHVMNKVLIALRREALLLDSPIDTADLASLANAMTELEHEVGRSAPRPGVFNRHVEVAIGALRRTAIAARSPRPSALAGREAEAKRKAPRSPMTDPVLAFPLADGR